MLTKAQFRARVERRFYAPTLNRALVFDDGERKLLRLLYPSSNVRAEIESMWKEYQIREGNYGRIVP